MGDYSIERAELKIRLAKLGLATDRMVLRYHRRHNDLSEVAHHLGLYHATVAAVVRDAHRIRTARL